MPEHEMAEQAEYLIQAGVDAIYAHLDGDCGPGCEGCAVEERFEQLPPLEKRRLMMKAERRRRHQ